MQQPKATKHTQPHPPFRLLCICTGNICRSALLDQLLRQDEELVPYVASQALYIASAGCSDEELGRPMDRRMQQTMREAGYRCFPHKAQWAKTLPLYEYDLLLCATASHLNWIQKELAQQTASAFSKPSSLADADDLLEADLNTPADVDACTVAPARKAKLALMLDFASSPQDRAKDMPDPWYGSRQDFQACLHACEDLLPQLRHYLLQQVRR